MAINSLDVPGDKAIPKLQISSNNFKTGAGNLSTCRLVKIDFAEDSIYSTSSRHSSKKSTNAKSPYLSSDNVQLLSQVTEKTFVHKKDHGFSSFPLAVNIYKANSDEFKSLKGANKKAKKSVLTLPNDQAPMPQICTVSDINDSEYFNQDDDRKKLKKRNSVARNRKSRPRNYEFYDRDARYCSQMNINLDCSSTDMIKNYNEHTNRGGKTKSVVGKKQQIEEKPNPHDVWAVLRNINRFQFRPSPPMSEESFISPKKKKGVKRRNNRKDMRYVETCRTEEFAYISSFEVDSRSHSFSKSSSFDRITVIDKQDDFSNICKEFEERTVKTKKCRRGNTNKTLNKNLNKSLTNNINTTKASTRMLAQKTNNPKALEYNPKKQCNNNCGDTKQSQNKDCSVLDVNKNEFDNPLFQEINENQFINEADGDRNVDQKFIYSGNSGSSKAGIEVINKKVAGKTKLEMESDDFNTLKGITKVILSKGPIKSPPKKLELPKRIHQASLLPNRPVAPKSTMSTVLPKLTQTDIRRRLAKLKFPIVILGKDQLSSNYEVMNPEPIQFDGLNEQVWPFMVQWQHGENDKRVDTLHKKTEISPKKKYSPEILDQNKTQKINRGFIPPKQHNSDKKSINGLKNQHVITVEQRHITPPAELQQQTLPKKPRPIHQLKEKVLKLLYKNSSTQNFAGENKKTGAQFPTDLKTKPAKKFVSLKVDASTDTRIVRTSPKDVPRKLFISPVKIDKMPTARQPWAKAKWASDFIDNVIRKIKTGVYYTNESKQMNKKTVLECKEAEIQTIATSPNDNQVVQSISKITIKKKNEPFSIPGFDDNSLPALEIKTMNTNEISVKHCVANITVHFDVTVPNEPIINLKKSSSLIPLQVSESQSKIFKCKTSLINAMLPAELCSILPKMMWNLIEARQALTLPVVSLDKTISHLSTISEITRCESPVNLKFPFFCHLQMTLELQNLLDGCFMTIPKRNRVKYFVQHSSYLAKDLLPRLSRGNLFDIQMKKPCLLENSHQKQPMIALEGKILSDTQLNSCTALQPYPTSNVKLDSAYKRFDLTCLQKISSLIADKMSSCSQPLSFLCDKNITINLTTINQQGLENRLSIDIGKFISTSFENYPYVSDKFQEAYQSNLPAIQCIELKAPLEDQEKKVQNQPFVNNKTKKKGFIKLYRKCKSASNISAEKNTTSLNKITCLDEFFQALGTAKFFSGVFDNTYGHKILSSLKEMKSWITDINPTQALLLLLLVNKKDTPNLVRFRPVLLQGIAVNRITRANELDMEIEVIERENLNRLTQYEGISYVVASTENQDNLLEELYWIAKTTASDYQRTFDESSEKLLKSLLEKRKKLNPSYLRVMARYVGLGLLKSPNKK